MRIVKKIFFSLVLLGFLTPFLVLGYFLTVEDYDISSLVDYKPAITTRIYDKNGDKIANLFDTKHRYYASFEEIPPRVIEALVAIEDTTFFEHPGINVDAIFRAIIKDVKARKMVEGASTITQQLVKNKLLTREKKLSRKIKEVIYSIKLEKVLSKEQILERYLNEIYFGHGYYGIKTAADGYFHKNLNELTLKEMAILVGLPKAPSTYAPTKNYEISMGRANRVIQRMYVLGWIDEETYNESLVEAPQVYDDTLTQNLAPFIVDEVTRRTSDLGIDDIKTGGYEIYTTIDMRLQEAARESLKKAYDMSLERIEGYRLSDQRKLEKNPNYEVAPDVNTSLLNGALVSLDSKSGDILALVGSVDYKTSPYNRATQGRRQPGSAFKPFIYQVAVDLGYSGATELVDMARTYTYEKNGEELKWQPRNYEKNYKGLISLREALVHSRNLATINLVNDIGLRDLLNEFKKFGIENLPPDLSISLGTISLSPLQLAKYYTSFANSGIQVEPHLIRYIDKNLNTIYEKQEKSRFITEATQAYIMTTILRDVVKRGTGRRARARGIELAGKTGTTNNNVDGWFAGYSPTIETVVWFGNDDNTPMHKKETGGKIAGPAFSMYYQNVLKLYPQIQRKFEAPEGIIEVDMNGKKEYFSEISKPPRSKTKVEVEEELLF
ncbi:MAG: PBP1A family penicillin-binding protein [Sulfurimonas sp.]|uniref:penicillin-binding protein 1A n=1 Tax=Sulfurimonas sp. TaxID=2022749 RepID=UPI00262976CD|nr:PBP1A family penicillin-binding protein [Sulfurimonas sp.]MCW8895605.1 PBP1A family penicillin-binding protein [Sulfurimonas sp.]MCW8954776.1 PBP1A family penicillin-binding protein [Sulfurimonas sp.]MCW9067155.1 PBP1A family penicillin-binding protein [Sulfurimonas sp.]